MKLRIGLATKAMRPVAVLGVGAALALSAVGCGSPVDQATTTAPASVDAPDTQESAGAGTQGATGAATTAPSGETTGPSTVSASPPQQPEPRSESAAPVAEQPSAGSGHGLCFDLNSTLARDAVASLAPAPQGGPWRASKASTDPLSQGCPDLSWMQVDDAATNDGTFASHVLFFHDGRYLGTATQKPLPFTQVTGSDKHSVSVQYRWITDNDPLCCPQGGPSTVTFTWNGSAVQPHGQFPPAA